MRSKIKQAVYLLGRVQELSLISAEQAQKQSMELLSVVQSIAKDLGNDSWQSRYEPEYDEDGVLIIPGMPYEELELLKNA